MTTNRDGLFCRYPDCDSCFRSDGTVEGIRDSANMRNEHEVLTHGYVHQELSAPASRSGVSHRGRSTLSLRKRGVYT